MTSIYLIGESGRMGSMVKSILKSTLGKKAKIVRDAATADVVIDFSSPEALRSILPKILNVKGKIPSLISGTTGLGVKETALFKKWAKRAPVLHATNFSPTVFLFGKILGMLGPKLKRLGYEAMIVEAHHKHKKDAPSGTAKTLHAILGNDKSIPVQSIRKGEIIGDHFVGFYGPQDEILLQHRALSREIFASGAVNSALWVAQSRKKKPSLKGFFTLGDYLDGI